MASHADQLQAFDTTLSADAQAGPGLATAGQAAAAGARNMDQLIADTRAGIAALAPNAGSAAGKQELATYLQGQLNRAKALLQDFQQRDTEIAGTIQAADYRSAAGPDKQTPPAAPLDAHAWKPGDRHLDGFREAPTEFRDLARSAFNDIDRPAFTFDEFLVRLAAEIEARWRQTR
ncbi:hypothetical protein LAUMK41_05707 [Mycobacterium attenuatum]|nr:hypothetical protein LAUMK41_05707 [Mycobacterium attenuatum]